MYDQKVGLYDPSYEHDACGIGAIAQIKGIKTHKTIKDALNILIHLEHRGGTVYWLRMTMQIIFAP